MDEAKIAGLQQGIIPIFEPGGDYYVITGRPKSDKKDTLDWFHNLFINPPIKIFHDNEDMAKAHEYKLKVLEENKDITVFIESDLNQVSFLRENISRKMKIIHFEEMIYDRIREIENEG